MVKVPETAPLLALQCDAMCSGAPAHTASAAACFTVHLLQRLCHGGLVVTSGNLSAMCLMQETLVVFPVSAPAMPVVRRICDLCLCLMRVLLDLLLPCFITLWGL